MNKKILIVLLMLPAAFSGYSQSAEQHLANGISKFKQKDYMSALAEFNNAINKDKKLSKAYNNRGIIRSMYGYDSSAIADFSTTIVLDSLAVSAYTNRGIVKLKRGYYTAAIADFQKALAINPDDIVAQKKLETATFLLDYQAKNHGLKNNQELPEIKDQPAVSKVKLFESRTNVFNDDDKITGGKSMPPKQESGSSGRFISLDDYIDRGNNKVQKLDFIGAYKEYSKAIEQDTGNAKAYYLRGVLKLKFKDYKDLEFNVSNQLDKKTTTAELMIRQELLKAEFGAIEDFSKAIKLDSAYAEAYYMRAMSFYYLKEYRIAIIDFNRSILYNDNFADAYYYRGMTRGLLNELSGACLDFLKAATLGNKEAADFVDDCK